MSDILPRVEQSVSSIPLALEASDDRKGLRLLVEMAEANHLRDDHEVKISVGFARGLFECFQDCDLELHTLRGELLRWSEHAEREGWYSQSTDDLLKEDES